MPKRKRPGRASPKRAARRADDRAGIRLPFKPTDEQRKIVSLMVAGGIPEAGICLAMINPATGKPIDEKTLRKHFRAEIDGGFHQANAKVMLGLFRNATEGTEQHPGGHPVSQFFWLKTRAHWRQHGPPPAPPQAPEQANDLREAARRIAFALALGAAEAERRVIDVAPKPKIPA